jgi:tRNA A37 threonylcarbamoyladenosine modification protein TsaB|tara:strand:+ start:612 stop:1229 length:618 start_codon:yes stop_codon:yes gene_type:complete
MHTQIGIIENAVWLAFTETKGDALETIFRSIDQVLKETGRTLSEIASVAIGIGPGSILGLRLSLMALETWRALPQLKHWQCYAFHGLELQAQFLRTRSQDDFHLMSDFRGESWHLISVVDGVPAPLQIADDEALKSLPGTLYYSPTGRGRQKMPRSDTTEAVFSLSKLPALAPGTWAKKVETPELYLPSPPVFKKWDAKPHRGHA